MAKVTTSISLDTKTKEQATTLFSKLNLDMSTAVGLFLTKCVQEQGLPFSVKAGPTAYEVVSGEGDYNDDPILLGNTFVMEDYSSAYIHYYNENFFDGKMGAEDVLHAMCSVMSIAREMFSTPGVLAADIANSIFSDISNPIDEKDFFDALKVEDPQNVTYKLLFSGSDGAAPYIVRGFPACTLNRIEQAVALRRNDKDFKLSQSEIFGILQYPLGWIYAIAKHRAESVIKHGREIRVEDMETFVNGVMHEMFLVSNEFRMAEALSLIHI